MSLFIKDKEDYQNELNKIRVKQKSVSIAQDVKEEIGVKVGTNTTNVVEQNVLRKIQSKTLRETKDYISHTFGPMGSNTKIITGNNKDTITSIYSKDGLKVLEKIANSGPIESSILEELINMVRYVEKEVGDGTTSTVILSSLIFDQLIRIQDKFSVPPYQLMRTFNGVVNRLRSHILTRNKKCDVNDIFDIAMISTNGNEEVSRNIANIYEQFGMDVELVSGISNTVDSVIKVYDGLTLTEGFADPAYINNRQDNTAEIHDAYVYHFADPIDTMDMINYFEAILTHNLYERLANDEAPIPTVITCPRLSRDMTASLKTLTTNLLAYDNMGAESGKPPILIISNVVASDEAIMDDIATLCGCKSIRKYIDPNIMKRDQEAGLAPTLENVHEFFGKAELVVADDKKTKFINPDHMIKKVDEDGNTIEDPVYKSLVNFLETEIANIKPTANAGEIGTLKKRLSALKSNMVEYLVGGITVAERDSVRDLVIDAIKNCISASEDGVGYAANWEGLNSCYEAYETRGTFGNEAGLGGNYVPFTEIEQAICEAIYAAYIEIACILYGTVCTDEDRVLKVIADTLTYYRHPIDISSGELETRNSANNVKCSIMLDVYILDTISKIITMMVTCNQCLLQAPQLNTYS